MARALWRGSISFGLINIPVEMHKTIREHRPRFRMLHGKDHSPVRYDHVCQAEGRKVSWDELVKGYEYEEGHFVVLTKEDFQTAALERSKTLEILHFVEPGEIDTRYLVTPYYLSPAAEGAHAYAVLREALRESGKVGVGRVIMRDSQHLTALHVVGDALVATMLRYHDEIEDPKDLGLPDRRKVRKAELDMARALLSDLSEPWRPEQYTDEYLANLQRIIKAKLKGKKAALPAPETGPKEAAVIDLMERLRKSLEEGSRGKGHKAAPRLSAGTKTRRTA